MSNNFSTELRVEIKRSTRNAYSDNWDEEERGPEPAERGYPAFRRLGAPFRAIYRAICRHIKPYAADVLHFLFPTRTYLRNVKRFRGIEYLYCRLADDTSKQLLVQIMAYRLMGHRKVKLARNDGTLWSNVEHIDRLPVSGTDIHVDFQNLQLPLRDLTGIGFDLRCYCTSRGASCVFIQKQYELDRDGIICKAEKGDVAIDAGGCWGDTALYFAHEVGETGKVYCYEFVPSNLAVLEKNLAANSNLSSRITVIPQPLWEHSDRVLYYVDWGPGSRASFKKLRADFEDTKCTTTTIDDTVASNGIDKIDFIKMDIEGAELNALRGAEKSLRRFRPKLAISLYHSLEDFETIPRYIDSLNLNYDFYLEHHTIYENETVLFCVPKH